MVQGFCINLGLASNISAEQRAIAQGLKLAWEMGLRKVVLEIDFKTSLGLIKSSPRGSLHHNIIPQIKEWMVKSWSCKLSHI